jgi:hypothetical protein
MRLLLQGELSAIIAEGDLCSKNLGSLRVAAILVHGLRGYFDRLSTSFTEKRLSPIL